MRSAPIVSEAIQDFFSGHPELKGKALLVAYSGGVDSSVLLAALAASSICPLRAVHVVHNIRAEKELSAERAIVTASCRRLGIPLTIATIRRGAIEELAGERGIGTEAAARELRYGILKRIAKRKGYGMICTAHNADDQLETLIGRFISASSLDGLSGMRSLRDMGGGLSLARPLLSVSRKEIERYAASNGIPYSTDSTNAMPGFTRNRIRNTLVPVLDQGFPGWRKGLLETSARLDSDREVLGGSLSRILSSCRFESGRKRASVDLERFLSAPAALRTRILARGLSAAGRRGRLSHKAMRAAADAIARGVRGLDLLGVRIFLREGRLEFLPILDFRTEDRYFFQVDSEGLYRSGPISLSLRWMEPEASGTLPMKDREMEPGYLLEGSFSFPLVVRSRKPGDMIEAGEGGRKVDELLQSWHLEKRLKDAVPVIEDRRGIVAVLATSLSGSGLANEKFRDFSGSRDGRRLYIRMKGA